MTHSLDNLRSLAHGQQPERLAEYRALWAELWADWRGLSGKTMNEEVRAVVLGFLIEGVPAATAKMVTLEFMKGLKR